MNKLPFYDPKLVESITETGKAILRPKHSMFGSDGVSLNFHSTELYEEYEREELLLKLTYYVRIRNQCGIYCGNQNTYVAHVSEMKERDSKNMEQLLVNNLRHLDVEVIDRGFITGDLT